MRNIFWLAEQAFSGLLYAWPLTLAILILAVFGGFIALGSNRVNWRRFVIVAVFVWLFPILILGAGSVWANAQEYPSESTWRSTIVVATVGIHALVVLVSIVVSRGARTFMAGISLMALFFSLSCWFVSAMSIANDWI